MLKKLLALLLIATPLVSFGATPALTVPQGGTGWGSINAGSLLFGGTSLRLATSSNLFFNTSSNTLQVLNFSGTSATTTNLGITGILSKLLKTTSNGGVIGATAGVDYENPLTFGTGVTRSVNAVTCDTASGSVFGCLLSIDWTKFNNKLSSTSVSATLPITYNSSTGVFGTSGGTFGVGNYVFPTDLTVTGNSTSTNFYATKLGTNSEYFTDLTGTGLSNSSGVLTVSNVPNASLANSSISFTSTDSSLSVPASIALGASGAFTLNLTNSNTWSSALTTFTNGVIIGNSTTTKATTTNLFSTIASTTAFYAQGLHPECNGAGFKVTYTTAGQFLCEVDQTGGGGVTGGTTGMLASWTGASTLTATGTPTFASFFATSSSATSTINGKLLIGSSTRATFGGLYPLFEISDSSGTLNDSQPMIYTYSTSTAGGNADIRIDSPDPDIELIDTDGGGSGSGANGYGKFEIEAQGGVLTFNSRAIPSNGSFERVMSIAPFSTGGQVGIGTAFDTKFNSSVLTVVATTSASMPNALAIGTTTDTVGQLMVVDKTGRVGILKTSPVFNLQVASSTKAQIALDDASGSNNLWTLRAKSNSLFFATSTTAGATSSVSALSINANGFPTIPSLKSSSGSNCLQVDTSGNITNTGSACGGGSGASTTLLADNNTFTGNNTFVKASTTSFAITGLSSTLLKVNANGSVIPAIADTDYLTPTTAGTTYLPLAGGTLTGSLTMSGGTQLVVPNGSSGTPFLVTNAGASFYDSGTGMMTIKSAGLALTDLSDASILSVDGTGNTTLPAGNLTLTAGNLIVTAGTITVSALSDGCLEVASGVITSTGSACGSGGGGYATIQDEGSGLTARTILNFTGSGVNCVDNAGSTRTDCTINAGAATAGGTNGQIQFNDSTALGGANGFVWNKSLETLGVGTTTPRWTMQLASSTRPQLALSDGSLTSDIWTMRNKNGNLYFATSSPSTFATSTDPAFMIGTGDPGLSISSSTPWGMLAVNVPSSHSWSNLFVVGSSLGTKFVIDNQGDIGIGTSTPYGILSIAATDYTGNKPLFAISTSTGAFGDILTVYGTSTTICSSIVGCESGARFSVGTTTLGNYGVLDQLYVDGRINSSWRNVTCDLFNSTSATVAQLAADTANVCPQGGLWFIEDGAAVYDPVAMTGVNGELYARLRTGTAGTATAAGDGAGITTVPIPFLSAGTSTPVMEVVARKAVINNASSSLAIIGFAQYSGVSADYATMPTNGCYFEASSTAANWWLVSAQGAANKTYTDTGVASSSVTTGTGKFYKFRIQVSTSECTGYIYRHGFDTIMRTNTTNLPTTIILAPFVTTATVGTAGLSKELHVSSFRVWWRGTNDMLSNGL